MSAIPNPGPSPIDQIGTLAANVPVAFFPVRLETRFRRSGNAGELHVRIYPDAILSDEHEPLLTENEAEAGRDYWRQAWKDRDERDAWTLILGETTAPRAAWIVAQLTPINLDKFGTLIPPQFPKVSTRANGVHRAPEARCLPDRWIVTAIREPPKNSPDGTPPRRVQVFSQPVREGLALTLRPSGEGESVFDLSGDGLVVEPALAWVYDFDEAVEAGMAVRMPVTAEDLTLGFDTLLAMGVRTSDPVDAQTAELEQLLNAHRHTRGLAFVPQGAPTNNTAGEPSYYPPADPAGVTSFAAARGPALATPGTDGANAARAFGIGTAPLDHIWGADRTEYKRARAMADAIWPATFGYFLEKMLPPMDLLFTVEEAREWCRKWVLARGPLSALRVGDVPYGLLPVGADWSRFQGEGFPDPPRPIDFLRLLVGLLLLFSVDKYSPHVGRSDDFDKDLIDILGMDASAQSIKIRQALGPDMIANLASFAGEALGATSERQRVGSSFLRRAVSSLDDEEEDDAFFESLTFAQHADDYAGPWVTDDPLSETTGLANDYVASLVTATPAQLRDPSTMAPSDPPPLLYVVLRHSLLGEYDRVALRILNAYGLALPEEGGDPELVGIFPAAGGSVGQLRNVWERFDLQVPGLTGTETLGEFLASPDPVVPSEAPAEVADGLTRLADFRAALTALVGAPTAELERMFGETLDVGAHRFDVWVTSLATRRLSDLRDQTPEGVLLGAYGWVMNLRPDPPVATVPVVLGDGTTVQARTDSGGYVYAPSMLHGATAAVLGNASMSRPGDTYSVDLSSRRVRTAMELLDSVREGQPLAVELGYRFERGLHEGHPGVELDRYIDPFRQLYPQVALKAEDSADPPELVAARNVVDGLRLLHAWQNGGVPFGDSGLPASGSERAAIEDELRRLDAAVDAVSDLLMAESVHQVVKGSVAGMGATLDTLAKGQRPPEPEVATIPRGGTVLHQRVALVLGDGTAPPGWSAAPTSPRAAAARELNSWIGRVLGPPLEFGCVATPEGGAPRSVTLADLGLQPIDLVLAAQSVGAEGSAAELERRVAWSVFGATGADASVTIDYEHTLAGGPVRPMAVAFELAASIGRLLGFGRALTAADLHPPQLDEPASDLMVQELAGRSTAARTTLTSARNALASAITAAEPDDGPLTALRTALVTAADFGVVGAFPTSRHASDDAARQALLAQGRSVRAELDRRVAEAAAGEPVDVLHAVFGRDLPVVPRFRMDSKSLAGALANEPDLGPEPDAGVEGWLAQLGRVRVPLDAWRDVRLYGRALGRVVPRPRIVQVPLEKLPDGKPARWAARPFVDTEPPPSGLVNLALLGATPPTGTLPWAGLLLDSWPEVIPAGEEDAGIVFHYDSPRAEAPQAVLLATPPPTMTMWNYAELETILLSTPMLAKIRALSLDAVMEDSGSASFIPINLLAANTANETVATPFAGKLVGVPTISTTATGGSGR